MLQLLTLTFPFPGGRTGQGPHRPSRRPPILNLIYPNPGGPDSSPGARGTPRPGHRRLPADPSTSTRFPSPPEIGASPGKARRLPGRGIPPGAGGRGGGAFEIQRLKPGCAHRSKKSSRGVGAHPRVLSTWGRTHGSALQKINYLYGRSLLLKELGFHAYRLEHFAEAQRSLERALALQPHDPELYQALAENILKLKAPDQGRAYQKKALEFR